MFHDTCVINSLLTDSNLATALTHWMNLTLNLNYPFAIGSPAGSIIEKNDYFDIFEIIEEQSIPVKMTQCVNVSR